MAILSTDEYPAIRAALDVALDANDLPDSIIALDIYAGAADQDVLNIDPDAEDRSGDEAARVLRAAIYFCAARLVPVVVRLTATKTQTRDVDYQRNLYDPVKRAEELRGLAQAELAEVLTPEEATPARPTMFTTAPGYRGR